MFKKYQHIHFVGIGGIGMSGIAHVLLNLGYHVTGSDLKMSDTTKMLTELGAKVFKGHDKQNVLGAHAVVVSSAVDEKNPEVQEAKKLGISVVPRAEMLAELMRLKYGIAVAGTHGKTSTTSLVGCLLDEAGFDPTLIIGGKVNNLHSNARLGKGEFFVAEADESDRSFLKLTPTIAVITNIDPEHMENYRDFDDMKRAYVEFANKVPFYGQVVACNAHPIVEKIIPQILRPCVTYGGKNAQWNVDDISQKGEQLAFDVLYKGKSQGRISIKMVGKHYALNALAAIAVAAGLDVPFATIKRAFESFGGVARRFQILNSTDPIVVDDYAHHPVEIKATLAAAKLGWPQNNLIAVLQPHRYSRLKMHFDEFVSSLSDADKIVITDVYPAGEPPHKIYTGEKLWKETCKRYPKKQVLFAKDKEEVMRSVNAICNQKDLVMFMGAGSITQMAKEFVTSLT